MLRSLSALIGIILTSTALAAGQTQFNVYGRMKEKYLQEYYMQDSEEDVQEFIARQLKEVEPLIVPAGEKPSPLSKDDVKTALAGNKNKFCTGRKLGTDSCEQFYARIRALASDLGRIRGLGRSLLAIATGYELGVSGVMGEPLGISTKFSEIIHLWQSGNDHLLSPVRESRIRGAAKPKGTENALQELDGKIYDTKEEMTAAVWRYRYGLASVKTEGACDDKRAPVELFPVQKQRWCDLERAMEVVVQSLPQRADYYDPPLVNGEIMLFPIAKLEKAEHVLVWYVSIVRNGKIESNIGLGWDLALEPVLPGLLVPKNASNCEDYVNNEGYCNVVQDKEILPGGLYPDPVPEPKEGQGVCALPMGRDGYLCRPQQLQSCTENIEREQRSTSPARPPTGQQQKPGPRSIVLTECKPNLAQYSTQLSTSGPDICRVGAWRLPPSKESQQNAPEGFSYSSVKDTSDEDDDLMLNFCDNCAVDLYCGICDNNADAATYPKNEKGVIKICINDASNKKKVALPELILHELVHAQQKCSLPPNADLYTTAEGCCAIESEAYAVQCNAVAESGLLKKAGVTFEMCVAAGINSSCKRYGNNVCLPPRSAAMGGNSNENPFKEYYAARKKTAEEIEKQYPNMPSCQQLIDDAESIEPRIVSMKESLKKTAWPGCETRYENTLGNNLCYMAQSIEDSLEFSRLIPGRMTEGVQDESYPWDSCAVPDPKNGRLLPAPVIAPVNLPDYNPRLLLQSMDAALCQATGLPALTPPMLCGFSALRRFNAPMEGDVLSFIMGFGNQQGESIGTSDALQGMAQGTAVRLATTMTLEYLERSLRSLTELMSGANSLLKQIEQIRFPMVTCPRRSATDNICAQFQ